MIETWPIQVAADIPYCGPAPAPGALWSAWNFDPWLLGALLLSSLVFLRFGASRTTRQRIAFWTAIALFVLAFVSPLCALSTALFSARVLHHVVLVALAAPLLSFALAPSRPGPSRFPMSLLFCIHAALLWLWHAPAPYAYALSGDAAYWLMEGSLLVSAVALWSAIFRAGATDGRVLAVLLGSVIQMGMLGALLTFAGWPLLEAHLATTAPFGLTPLEDQQLAGLVMWVPACLPYMAAALYRLYALLSGPDLIALRKTG